jgi:ureidoacrylate peracid hydrolase
MTAQIWSRSAGHVDLHPPADPPIQRRLTASPQHVTLDVRRSALVIVDMQNDFCHPQGWLGSIGVDVSGPRAAIQPCRELADAARRADLDIVWLNWGNRSDQANLPANVTHVYDADGSGGGIGEVAGRSEAVLTEGSWGAEVVEELPVLESDFRVSKYRMSGFFDTELDSILRLRGIDTIFFAGVNADQCVLATLSDAACLGYNVILLEGASTTSSPEFCLQATLYNVRQCFGFTASWQDTVAMLGTV